MVLTTRITWSNVNSVEESRLKSRLTSKASLRRASLGVQHRVYGVYTAGTEPVVIPLIPASRASEHYEVSILSSGRALFRIMLRHVVIENFLVFSKNFNNMSLLSLNYFYLFFFLFCFSPRFDKPNIQHWESYCYVHRAKVKGKSRPKRHRPLESEYVMNSYRRAKVVTYLVRQGDMRHGRRHVFPVVQQSHYTSIQRFHASTVVLKQKVGMLDRVVIGNANRCLSLLPDIRFRNLPYTRHRVPVNNISTPRDCLSSKRGK